jgi:hypothetical protein
MGKGRPKLGKVAKDSQIMVRTTDATAEALQRIAIEEDRSVSWLLNDLAVKFVASRKPKKTAPAQAAQAKPEDAPSF